MHLVPDKKHPTLAFNSELRVKFGLKMSTNEKSNSHNQPASRNQGLENEGQKTNSQQNYSNI